MLQRILITVLLFLSALTLGIKRSRADIGSLFRTPQPESVVLITLDGMRSQEALTGFADQAILQFNPLFFSKEETKKLEVFTTAFFPKTLASYSNNGIVVKNIVATNSAKLSLPGYQNIMAGFVQENCSNNYCGFIQTQTLPERLLKEFSGDTIFSLTPPVAIVSSWDKIEQAVKQNHLGKVFTNTGVESLTLPWEMENLTNLVQIFDLPYGQRTDMPDVRKDMYTIDQAKRVIKAYHPRFLFISLNETDAAGHENNYLKYLNAIRSSDDWIEDIENTLWQNGYDKTKTTIILTTDHGRGNEQINWAHHSSGIEGSEKIWLMAKGPSVNKQKLFKSEKSGKVFTHSDIRPTIEALLGLCPISCENCGKPMEPLVSPEMLKKACKN